MRVLLDTHIFLWHTADPRRLTKEARRLIEGAEAVFVSAASLWEIALKVTIGKLKADPDDLIDVLERSGFSELHVTGRHAARVAKLALLHTDPFDRLLVAQAMCEPLTLLTADEALEAYGERVHLLR